jgi:hypothetical protein
MVVTQNDKMVVTQNKEPAMISLYSMCPLHWLIQAKYVSATISVLIILIN